MTADTDSGSDHGHDDHLLQSAEGTYRFKNVLYTSEHAQAGVRPERAPFLTSNPPSVETARGDARYESDQEGVPHVAKAVNSMGRGRTGAPYSYHIVPFYDPTIVEGPSDRWRALRAAYRSNDYEVSVDPNYTTGTVTVQVDQTEN